MGDGGSFDGSLLLENEPPHGGRSDEWWAIWHGLHKGVNPDAAAAIPLKDFLQTPQGLAEGTATSNLPRSTIGMTLLHQAALNGGVTCLGMLLRSGEHFKKKELSKRLHCSREYSSGQEGKLKKALRIDPAAQQTI